MKKKYTWYLKHTVSLTLSVTNKHKPQYFLTNVPDLELHLPVRFCSFFVLRNLDISAASQCPTYVHVTEVGANTSLKHSFFPGGLTEVSHPSDVKEL